MKKILVLGASGMLGSMVFDYLKRDSNYEVKGSGRDKNFLKSGHKQNDFCFFDAEKDNIKEILADFKPNYLINCIGVINKYCQPDNPQGIFEAIKINALFPYLLAQASKKAGVRIIQIATDCVFSGNAGNYLENFPHDALDVYGKTKSLGEVKSDNFLNIRCSIIGPELKNKVSLLEWFLSQPAGGEIKGFSHHQWNGVTTLQFAVLCQRIINQGDDFFDQLTKISSVHHFIPNAAVSKYELLKIFAKVFKKDTEIKKVEQPGPAINRVLATEFNMLTDKIGYVEVEKAVRELKDYIEQTNFYD